MTKSLLALGLMAFSFSAVLTAPALAVDTYKIKLINESQHEITGIQTFENGKWSDWSRVDVLPGDMLDMTWGADVGDCTAPFRLRQKTIETEQHTVDWCKISAIHVLDDGVTAE